MIHQYHELSAFCAQYKEFDQNKKNDKRGKKVGIAYELENGEIIYVPEEDVK